MWYLIVIRSLCIIFFGIATYSILLWVLGRSVPGRLRKHQKQSEEKYINRKVWIVWGYYFLLAFLIILGLIIIRYAIRGGL